MYTKCACILGMYTNRDGRLSYSAHFLIPLNDGICGEISVKRKHHLTACIPPRKSPSSLQTHYIIKTTLPYPLNPVAVQITFDESSTMVQVSLRYKNRS